jgi:penicillin amidase
MKRKTIVVIAAVVLAGLLIWLFVWLRSLIPDYEGELALPGLKAETEIFYDRFGVPHIYAGNAEDAYYALGYTVAQDRLFQMELYRRLASGRLSELVGRELVSSDKLFRTLNLNAHAEWSAKEFLLHAPDTVKRCTEAYLRGINAFMSKGSTPIEFTILDIPKEPFTLRDIYLITGFMAFGFAEGFRIDPMVEMMYRALGYEYMKDLEPLPDKPPLSAAIVEPAMKFGQDVQSVLERFPVSPWIGSNSWVLAPSRTKNKKSILCNDTHMGFMQPSVWYEAHLEYPGFKHYGNYLAGLPFALTGHSDFCANGLTMLENDDTDFFVEKLQGNTVYYQGQWVSLKSRTEKIVVKDSLSFSLSVMETPHGPVITKVLKPFPRTLEAVSVWWNYLKFPSRALESMYAINHARSMKEAKDAAALIHAPGLNITYGDREGNIAWWTAVKLIKRPEGTYSRRFLDGASGNDEMQGYYDFSENPSLENPASGIVVSANQQPDSNGSFNRYSGYYVPYDRYTRISKILSRRKEFTVDDMKKIMTDDTSDVYMKTGKWLRTILGAIQQDAIRSEAANRISSWGGEHKKQTAGAIIYYKWIYHILRLAMSDNLGMPLFEHYMNTHFMKTTSIDFINNLNSVWWDNKFTRRTDSRSDIVTEAWKVSMDELISQLGKDLSKWNWERVHQVEHRHPLGQKFPLNVLFNIGPDFVPGGNETINNTGFKINVYGDYKVEFGPAMRRIIDFSDIDNSQSVLPTGQSGYFLAPHYSDQSKLYANNEFRRQLMDKNAIVQQAANKSLKLKPTPR